MPQVVTGRVSAMLPALRRGVGGPCQNVPRAATSAGMKDAVQCSGTVLMVRPAAFGFNPEAALSNAFASVDHGGGTAAAALAEFDALADALQQAGIEVLILDDTADPPKPDAVFPNNWVSFHADGTIMLYPMTTAPRRSERRSEDVQALMAANSLLVSRVVDLSALEISGLFLEGTGSLILDRPLGRAFAALGPRTSPGALEAYSETVGEEVIAFECADRSGRPIYHTNVLLSLGERFAIVCSEAIVPGDRARVLGAIGDSGREIIEVDFGQMERFACNLLELRGASGPVIALSQTALDSLRPSQRATLEAHGELVAADIPTIERVGGGSVRCMIAEVHLPRRKP